MIKFLSLTQLYHENVVKSRQNLNFNTKKGKIVKIYDYNGKKNICGDRIHEARCRLRLTQSDLAARLQINGIIMERGSVSRMEIGTRFVADYELRELSKIVGVTVNWLLGLE